MTRYTIAVHDPVTDTWHAQLVTYDAAEAVQLVLLMRAEMPGVQCGAVGRRVSVEELARMGGREVEG